MAKHYIFVDCEAWGGCPATGDLTEIGAVSYPEKRTFYARLANTTPDPNNPAQSIPVAKVTDAVRLSVFTRFDKWLAEVAEYDGRVVMVSDNPAYDFQWINDGFWRALGRNPFGHSARRISDFYAGLKGNWENTSGWKNLRITPHDHNPVNDAMGNVEAFEHLQRHGVK